MTKATIFEATDALGGKHYRTSVSRKYSHGVLSYSGIIPAGCTAPIGYRLVSCHGDIVLASAARQSLEAQARNIIAFYVVVPLVIVDRKQKGGR